MPSASAPPNVFLLDIIHANTAYALRAFGQNSRPVGLTVAALRPQYGDLSFEVTAAPYFIEAIARGFIVNSCINIIVILGVQVQTCRKKE
jgi:ketopantoate reductase